MRIHLFGSLLLELGERRLGPRDFGGVKPKQVLEILLAARGRPVPKDRLADELWGELTPRNVTGTIETYVSLVRRSLTQAGVDAFDYLRTEREAYRFATEGAELDLDSFDALVAAAAAADTDIARDLLEEALSLVRGDVLEDEPYSPWAEALRGTYRARTLGAYLDAADAALAQGDLSGALLHAEAAQGVDRFSERAQRATMLALYALGRQHEALRVFCRFYDRLEEIGLRPTRLTREAQAAILREEDPLRLLPRPRRHAQAEDNSDRTRAIFILDPENDRFVDATAAGCSLLGFERHELLETPISAIHPAEMSEFVRFMEKIDRDGTATTIALTCRTKNGDFLPLEITAHKVEVDGRRFMMNLVRERSEHRNEEQVDVRSAAAV
jgi:PAS domain S-box-containing protein